MGARAPITPHLTPPLNGTDENLHNDMVVTLISPAVPCLGRPKVYWGTYGTTKNLNLGNPLKGRHIASLPIPK